MYASTFFYQDFYANPLASYGDVALLAREQVARLLNARRDHVDEFGDEGVVLVWLSNAR